jgi:hypothetical protein
MQSPNDQGHLPGPLLRRRIARSQNAALGICISEEKEEAQQPQADAGYAAGNTRSCHAQPSEADSNS